MVTTFSSREFNQDTGQAKKAAESGPVFITHHGKPSHVLLSIEEYARLTGRSETVVELLAMPATDYFEFEPPRLGGEPVRPADLG